MRNCQNSKFNQIFTSKIQILSIINIDRHWYVSINALINSDISLSVCIIDKIQNFDIAYKYINLLYYIWKCSLIIFFVIINLIYKIIITITPITLYLPNSKCVKPSSKLNKCIMCDMTHPLNYLAICTLKLTNTHFVRFLIMSQYRLYWFGKTHIYNRVEKEKSRISSHTY